MPSSRTGGPAGKAETDAPSGSSADVGRSDVVRIGTSTATAAFRQTRACSVCCAFSVSRTVRPRQGTVRRGDRRTSPISAKRRAGPLVSPPMPSPRLTHPRRSLPHARAYRRAVARSTSPPLQPHARTTTARRRKIVPPDTTRDASSAAQPPITGTCGPRRVLPTPRAQTRKNPAAGAHQGESNRSG